MSNKDYGQNPPTSKELRDTHLECYRNTCCLYALLSGNRENVRVRRAVLRGDGEVVADPLDFLCDSELKAKRALPIASEYALWLLVEDNPDNYENLPEYLQLRLGKVFLDNGLGMDGHYKVLYFKTKNYHRKEAPVDSTGIL